MAWSISITDEDWQDIERALHTWCKEDLIQALLSDDVEALEQQGEHVDHRFFTTQRARYAHLYHDTLVALCYERMQQHNTCDNGGYAYWIDRKGYWKVILTNREGA